MSWLDPKKEAQRSFPKGGCLGWFALFYFSFYFCLFCWVGFVLFWFSSVAASLFFKFRGKNEVY